MSKIYKVYRNHSGDLAVAEVDVISETPLQITPAEPHQAFRYRRRIRKSTEDIYRTPDEAIDAFQAEVTREIAETRRRIPILEARIADSETLRPSRVKV
jgi:hypothetical protein